MKILIKFILLVCFLSFFPFSTVKSLPTTNLKSLARKTVLVLFPYQAGLPQHVLAGQAIQDEFDKADDLDLDLYFEYMDINRFPGEAYQQQLWGYYAAKYGDKRIDLVILCNEVILNLWLEFGHEIAPGAPVVFFDIPKEWLAGRPTLENMTGVGSFGENIYSFEERVRLAAQMGLRILRGESASAIPVSVDGDNRFVFDHPLLQRYGISPRILSSGSMIKNWEYIPWEPYQMQILILGMGFFLLLLLVAYLIWTNRQLRHARLALILLNENLETQAQGRLAQLSRDSQHLDNRVSEPDRAKESLETNEERYRFLTENIKDVIWVFDLEDKSFSYVSPSVELLLGYTIDEIMAKGFDEVLALFSFSKGREDIEIKLASYLQNPASLHLDPIEEKMIRKDGALVWVETIANCHTNEETGRFQMVGVSREITARKQIEATLRKLSRAVEQSASAIMVTNKEGIIEFVNPAFEHTTGYNQQEVAGQKPSILKSGLTSSETYKNLWETISQGQVWRGELLNRKKNKDLYWEYVVISPVRDTDGQITDYVAVKDDITARKQAEATMKQYTQSLEELKERLHEQAIRDPLTGVFNRRFMMESLEREVERANREMYPLSLVMMDIDHFKSVNDVYGHLAGDQVLKDLARFLEFETRKSDIVCRYGGEEFVVLMPKISAVDARRRAESWRAEFQVFKTAYGDSLISVTISMGIAVKEDPTLTCDGLISRADLALYSAKQAGRNNTVVWQEK